MDILDMVYTTHWDEDEGEEVVDGDKVIQPTKVLSDKRSYLFNQSPDSIFSDHWNASQTNDFATQLLKSKIRGKNQPRLNKRFLDTTDFGYITDDLQQIIDLNGDDTMRFTTTHKIQPKGLNPPMNSENKMENWERRKK